MRFQKFKFDVWYSTPKSIRVLYTFFKEKEIKSIISFLYSFKSYLSPSQKLFIIIRLYNISLRVDSPHSQKEILSYFMDILSLKTKGCIVEAGAYKGGSTAKFSIVAKLAERKLVAFDSFEGLPDNNEQQETIFGGNVDFSKGMYCGTLDEVKENVSRFGHVKVCEFIKGWFDKTMPNFSEPIAAIYLDVDLASSTRTCLKWLYPLLVPGGILYSQDGHLPLVIEVFNNEKFWKNEVGCQKPHVEGLGTRKLIRIVKPTEKAANVWGC